jgi:hypothetical protein
MGIKEFNKFIKSNYPSCIKQKWLQQYDNIYIDLNACLHNISYVSKSRDDMCKKLEQYIMNIIHELNPKSNVILASDGPAPLAKLLLQRSRRLDMVRKGEIDLETTSLNFTPGTKFMDSLADILEELVDKITLLYRVNVHLMIDKVDEAEIKIKHHIFNSIKNNSKKRLTYCVVSNDADVIVLLMNLQNIHNVYIMHKKSSCIEILNLGVLIDCHTDKFGCSSDPKYDFMSLNIMLGNDYLPKVQYITFDKLWKSYRETLYSHNNGLIYNKTKISQEFLIDLITNIIKNTPKHFIKHFKLETYDDKLYENYWDGYLWCIDTYNHGICTNYNYSYNYSTSPHPVGLLLSLYKKNEFISFEQVKTEPICKELYSILLIPKTVKQLLNDKYQNLTDSKELEMLYDEELCKCCKKYNKLISKLNKKYLKSKKEDDENSLELKKEITNNMNKYYIHKKQHKKISKKNINTILKVCQKANLFCN